VLYARRRVEDPGDVPSRFGFIVSKAVGNAVARNLVKRRLRAVAAQSMERFGTGYDVVVRALAPAAGCGWEALAADARGALEKACRAADRKVLPEERDTDGER
jgi:ribonuclease P protein component